MLEDNKDTLGIKNFVDHVDQSFQDDEDIRDSKSYLFDELLKILSKTSSKIRDEVTKIKKEMLVALAHGEVADKSWEWRLSEVVDNNPDSSNLMYSLNVFSALKELWLWNEEKAKSYKTWLPDFDEDVIRELKRFVRYEDSFVGCYERLATEYMRKNKKIPSYRTILRMTFCEYVGRYMKIYLKNLKFSEDSYKENFWVIQEKLQEKWLELEASDNIRQAFIQLCREKYPLAKKNYDFLFDNKTARREFLTMAEQSLCEWLGSSFDNIIKCCIRDVDND